MEGRRVEVKAADHLLVFKREIRESEADLQNGLLLVHRFFDYFARDSEVRIKEYLRDEVYCFETIMTNVSATAKNF